MKQTKSSNYVVGTYSVHVSGHRLWLLL